MTANLVTAIGTLLAAAVALGTAIFGVYEYRRQGKQKRAEHFLHLRERFKKDVRFKEIILLLEKDDPKIREIPKEHKRDYLGFFEEIALMVNSRLIQPTVAQYMFGFYAIICRDSEHFWLDFEAKHEYWRVFHSFCDKMKAQEEAFSYDTFKL